MSGYLGNKKATESVLDKDGWFNTGDLGMLLSDSTLVLTGRSKDTIVLNNGENIEPGPLEEALLSISLIEQVMLVGQDKKQLGVLLVPKNEEILSWAKNKGLFLPENISWSPGDLQLRKLLRREINECLFNRPGSRPEERVCDVVFVDPFTIENGLLTQTLKQRRDKISERDEALIFEMFKY